METNIRKANLTDAALLAGLNVDVQKLHADAIPHIFKQPSAMTFPPSRYHDLMTEPTNVFFVAEEDGEAVGYLWAEIRRRPENASQYERNSIMIHHISVNPPYQHNGHGARLIGAAKQLAKDERISTVLLDTWSFNTNAQAFFANQGFEIYNYRMWTEVS